MKNDKPMTKTELKKNITKLLYNQTCQLGGCEEKYRVEDTIERWDSYFCIMDDEGMNNPALYCDCCGLYVAPRGYTGDTCEHFNPGNNKDLKDGYDDMRWFIEVGGLNQTESDDYYEYANKTIIVNKDGNFEAKFICDFCSWNISTLDKPSDEDAEKYVEENGIEYW